MNFVALSEMLYARSQGEINLLSSERMRKIAAYPACLQLSGSYFANFSDCNELVHFHPGFITRLAERTQEHSLYNLLAQPVQPEHDWRLTTLLWNVLWWDGTQPEAAQLADARLDDGGVVRMVAQNKQDDGQCVNIVLAAKAGHNDENHNQNDIASFIVHAAGESFLVDPGRGLYTRAYFSPARYENIFANSYGHSVPCIDGHLQGTGRQFAGCLLPITTQGHGTKRVTIDFTHAYPDVDLQRAIRELTLQTEGALAGTLWLRDSFAFASDNHEVEEAFVTWFPCELHDNQARIHGQRHDLLLTLEPPLHFALESLDEQSRANAKASSLQRLSVVLPRGKTMYINIKIQLVAVQTPSA
jgi:hypothetical protein